MLAKADVRQNPRAVGEEEVMLLPVVIDETFARKSRQAIEHSGHPGQHKTHGLGAVPYTGSWISISRASLSWENISAFFNGATAAKAVTP